MPFIGGNRMTEYGEGVFNPFAEDRESTLAG